MRTLLTLSDGRQLEWADNDVVSDEALIFHNGTTCGLDVWNAWLKQAAAQGVRAIGVNRPGIGASTRSQGRRMLDDVSDVRELTEQLGIKKFVSIGWSGGGGRALGSTLIDSCVAAHTIAGIPSQDPSDPLWMSTVEKERHERAEINRSNWDAMLASRSATFEEDKNMTPQVMLSTLEKYLPHFEQFRADYEVFAHDFAASIRDALVQGPEPDGDDYHANIHLWGFKIQDITKPVTIWHGDLDDDVEIMYGEYNHSRIAGSKFIELTGLGHVDIMVEARAQILPAAIQSLKTEGN